MHDKIDYIQYLFNFGVDLRFQCKGKPVMIAEVLMRDNKMTDICKSLGSRETLPFYSLINRNNFNEGIYVTFSSQEKCVEAEDTNDQYAVRKTRFKIICNRQQQTNVRVI